MITKRLAFPFTLAADPATDGTFSGYASVFGVEDWYGDVVEPGAFADSLAAWKAKGRAPAMLWQHDSDRPVGTWEALAEDGKGLRVDGKLAIKTRDGLDAYEHLRARTLSGLSIGYSIPKGGAEWDDASETYRLRKINLWETSLVTFPANDQAQIDTIKGALGSPRDLERYLRECGLGRAEARALLAGGYKDLLASRDADSEGAAPNSTTRDANGLGATKVRLKELINAVRR